MSLFNRKPKARTSSDFGKHELDFEHRCCFREQIVNIGSGTKYGSGELIEVAMQSGKTAIYRLFAERVDYSADDTGQRHWCYHFEGYKT